MSKVPLYTGAAALDGTEVVHGVQSAGSVKIPSSLYKDFIYKPIYKNANYTANISELIFADSSAGSFTVTLPATPAANDFVSVWDCGDNAGTAAITVDRNGNTINGVADNFSLNMNGGRVDFLYTGTTWVYSYVIQTIQPSPIITVTKTLIQKITNTTAGEFDFNNIPSGYDRLIIKGQLRGDEVIDAAQVHLYVNEDLTDANYHSQLLTGYNGAGYYTEAATPRVGVMSAATSPANSFGQISIEIEEPDSSKLKIAQSSFGVYRANDSIYVGQHQIASEITAAITRLRIRTATHPTDNFFGTLFLYGEKEETLTASVTNNPNTVSRNMTGTTDTLLASDAGKVIYASNGSAQDLGIPDGLPVGFQFILAWEGVGEPSVSMDGTETIVGDTAPAAQYKRMHVEKRDATTWWGTA